MERTDFTTFKNAEFVDGPLAGCNHSFQFWPEGGRLVLFRADGSMIEKVIYKLQRGGDCVVAVYAGTETE